LGFVRLCGSLVDIYESQREGCADWCAGGEVRISNVDVDVVGGLGFEVERCASFEEKGIAAEFKDSCVITGEGDNVGAECIIGDVDVSEFAGWDVSIFSSREVMT
jgi:hypothetical protein